MFKAAMKWAQSHRNSLHGEPCRRTQQKRQALCLLCYDGGFTQSWDTVGAGKKSHAESP